MIDFRLMIEVKFDWTTYCVGVDWTALCVFVFGEVGEVGGWVAGWLALAAGLVLSRLGKRRHLPACLPA